MKYRSITKGLILAGLAGVSIARGAESTSETRKHEAEPRRHRVEVRNAGRLDPLENDRVPRPLLVFTSTPEEGTIRELQEDLAVMSRILDKQVKEIAASASFTAMGINVLTFPGTRPSRNVFLEDYGVIFALRVNMPLIPPGREESEGEEKKDLADTAWEEAKNELFGHTHPREKEGAANQRYDAGSVEELKKSLLQALRNATHIRNLADSDWVTIVVTGQPSGAPARVEFQRALRFEFQDMMFWDDGFEEGSSTLVLRAKKADIDQFAKDKEADAFKKKVSVAVY